MASEDDSASVKGTTEWVMMADLVQCKLCFKTISNPRVLSDCHHVFCFDCLWTWWQESSESEMNSVICPTCRAVCALPTEGISALLGDLKASHQGDMLNQCIVVVNKVEADNAFSASGTGPATTSVGALATPLCDVCSLDTEGVIEEGGAQPTTALQYCHDCQNYLCKACSGKHAATSIFSRHKVRDLGKVKSSTEVSCAKHPGKALKYFCTTCPAVSCSVCVTTQHSQGHGVMEISDMIESCQKELWVLLDEVRLMSQGLDNRDAITEQLVMRTKDTFWTVAKQVSDHADRCRKAIEEAEVHLLEQIEARKSVAIQRTRDEGKKRNYSIIDLETLQAYGNRLLTSASPLEFVSNWEELKERMKTVLQFRDTVAAMKLKALGVQFVAQQGLLSLGRLEDVLPAPAACTKANATTIKLASTISTKLYQQNNDSRKSSRETVLSLQEVQSPKETILSPRELPQSTRKEYNSDLSLQEHVLSTTRAPVLTLEEPIGLLQESVIFPRDPILMSHSAGTLTEKTGLLSKETQLTAHEMGIPSRELGISSTEKGASLHEIGMPLYETNMSAVETGVSRQEQHLSERMPPGIIAQGEMSSQEAKVEASVRSFGEHSTKLEKPRNSTRDSRATLREQPILKSHDKVLALRDPVLSSREPNTLVQARDVQCAPPPAIILKETLHCSVDEENWVVKHIPMGESRHQVNLSSRGQQVDQASCGGEGNEITERGMMRGVGNLRGDQRREYEKKLSEENWDLENKCENDRRGNRERRCDGNSRSDGEKRRDFDRRNDDHESRKDRRRDPERSAVGDRRTDREQKVHRERRDDLRQECDTNERVFRDERNDRECWLDRDTKQRADYFDPEERSQWKRDTKSDWGDLREPRARQYQSERSRRRRQRERGGERECDRHTDWTDAGPRSTTRELRDFDDDVDYNDCSSRRQIAPSASLREDQMQLVPVSKHKQLLEVEDSHRYGSKTHSSHSSSSQEDQRLMHAHNGYQRRHHRERRHSGHSEKRSNSQVSRRNSSHTDRRRQASDIVEAPESNLSRMACSSIAMSTSNLLAFQEEEGQTSRLLWESQTMDLTEGETSRPRDVGFLPNGEVFVLNDHCHNLVRFSADGRKMNEISNDFTIPMCLVMTPDGQPAVTDSHEHSIKLFSLDGASYSVWKLDSIMASGAAITRSGSWIVLDKIDDCFGVFPDTGSSCSRRVALQKHLLYTERYMACDSKGRIFISGSEDTSIAVFDSDGNHIHNFGGAGSRGGYVSVPRGLYIDSRDNLLVADRHNHRVSMFSPDGRFIRHIVTCPFEKVVWPTGIDFMTTTHGYRRMALTINDKTVQVYDVTNVV